MKKPLSSLDLNLLLCLQLLTQELSVTRTAKRMNVSPSAVSKSLAKLRAWFDDPLFVKTPLGLSPTPLMSSMEQDLADWMQMGNQILDKPHHTMPSGLKFELAAESPLLMILLNSLSQRIYQRYPQALIPPQERPNIPLLRQIGFDGSDEQVLEKAARQAPELLSAASSASSMWVANAATVSPSADSLDGRVHLTVANLNDKFHRASEAPTTEALLKAIFPDAQRFAVHGALPQVSLFGDEGEIGRAHV